MPQLFNRRALLFRAESAYGVPADAAGATALPVYDLTVQPMALDPVARPIIGPQFGPLPSVPTRQRVEITCTLELTGARRTPIDPGNGYTLALAYQSILRCCGLSVTTGQTVTVRPGVTVSNAIVVAAVTGVAPSISLWVHMDGAVHQVLGVRGSCQVQFQAGQIPTLALTLMGLLVEEPVEAAALPVTDYSLFTAPQPVQRDSTPSVVATVTSTGDEQALNLDSLSIDLANSLQYHNRVGTELVLITDRVPTGSISFEALDPADQDVVLNPWTVARDGDLFSIRLVHQVHSNNEDEHGSIILDLPFLQITTPTYADNAGVLMIQSDLVLSRDVAGVTPLFSLTFT